MMRQLWSGAFLCVCLVAQEPAHAQLASGGTVTLFGLVDAGISYVSNEGGKSNVEFDDGMLVPNLVGLQGTEELGSGVHAIFRLVSQFNLGQGTILTGGNIFGNTAYIGLASADLGTVTLGNQYDFMTTSLLSGDHDTAMNVGLYGFRAGPFAKIGIPSNPSFAPSFDWDRTASASVSNSIKYQSPESKNFKFGIMYGFGGVPGSLGSGDSISAGMNYDYGAFGVGAAYTEIKYVVSDLPQVGIRNWGFGAHYQFQAFNVSALVTTVRNTSNGGAIAQGEVGGSYQIAPDWVFATTYMYMKGDKFLDNNHAHQVSAVVDYFLSKRSLIYVEAVYQRANSGARALINGVLDPAGTSSGSLQLIARVGFQTQF